MGSGIRVGVWMMAVVSLVVYLKNSVGARGEVISSMEVEKLEKPQRPRVFTSPEELKSYLGALARYYATVSRNRFGKRSPRAESFNADLMGTDEVYDLFQSTNTDK